MSEPLQALRHVILAIDDYRSCAARHFGLSVVETQVISHLMVTDELGPTELGQRLSLTPGAVTALLDRLESAGMVFRRPHASDRRRTVVTLSEESRAIVKESSRWFERAFDGFEADELARAVGVLEQLSTNLHRQAASIAAAPFSERATRSR